MRKETILASMIALSGCAGVRQSAGLVSIEDLDRPVKAISQPQMRYSEVWQPPHGSGRTAEAIIAFTVQEDGSVADVSVLRATNSEVGKAALEAVKKWRFESATCRGVPARFQMKVPIVADLSNTTFITP